MTRAFALSALWLFVNTTLRHHPKCNNLVFAHTTPSSSDPSTVSGHRVEILEY